MGYIEHILYTRKCAPALYRLSQLRLPEEWYQQDGGIRTSRPCCPIETPNLTMIYGPKYLYENSRIQLRSFSSPGEHKAKNSCVETGGRTISHFLHQFFPQADTAQNWEKCTTLQVFPQGNKKRGVCVHCSSFLEGCLRDWVLSCFT